MNADGWVKIIAAIGGALVVVIAALMPVLIAKVNRVHTLVNSQHAALVAYVGVLTGALKLEGITVPTPAGGAVTGGPPPVTEQHDPQPPA
jgi:hypothetical protein